MADLKNHYSQQIPDNKLVTTTAAEQPIGVDPTRDETCVQKVQRKFQECTDILANYFECTRVFSTQKLQELRKKAINNERESQSYNKTNKSQISEQSQKYSQLENKQELKSYTKKQKDILMEDYNQLPAQNYSSNQRLRFTKRYAQIYEKSYSERKNKFGYTFEEVELDRQRQYLKKSKNFWEELKRLICCRGGNYLQQLQQVQTDALSQAHQVSSIKSSVKKQPSLASNKNKQQNNIFLFQQQNSPKQYAQQPVFTKHGRKVNKNIKIVSNQGVTGQQKSSRKTQMQKHSQFSQQKQIRKNYSRLGVDTQLLVKRKQYQQRTQGDYTYKQSLPGHQQQSQPQLPSNKKINNHFGQLQEYRQQHNYHNNGQREYNQISDEQYQAQKLKSNNSNIDTISSNRTTNNNFGNGNTNNANVNGINNNNGYSNYDNSNDNDGSYANINNANNRNDTFNINKNNKNNNRNPYENNYNTINVHDTGYNQQPKDNTNNDQFQYNPTNNNNTNNNNNNNINNRYNTVDVTQYDKDQLGVPKPKIDKKAKMSKLMKDIENQNDQQFNSSKVVFFSDDIKNAPNQLQQQQEGQQQGQQGQQGYNNNNNNKNDNKNDNQQNGDDSRMDNSNYQRIKKSKNKGKDKFKMDQTQQEQPAIDILDEDEYKDNHHHMTNSKGDAKNKSNKLIIRQNAEENMGYTLDQIPDIQEPEHVGPETSAFKKKRKMKKNLKQVQEPEDMNDSQIIFQEHDEQANDNVANSKLSGYSDTINYENSQLYEMKNAPQQMFKKKKNKRKNLVVTHEDDQEVLDLEDI